MIADARYLPLKSESVNCIITSPPYWSLRKYDIPDLVWDGDRECNHQWKIGIKKWHSDRGDGRRKEVFNDTFQVGGTKSDFCSKCGAWRDQLGLEPTIELYLSHLLQITKEIWRVLRKDGVFFINIGDSYWGGKGRSAHGDPERHIKRLGEGKTINRPYQEIGMPGKIKPGDGKHEIIKPKDLCLIPFRLALELQKQGWWVRSDIIWAKPNPMPESVKDRPTRSHEYLFLLTKSGKALCWKHDNTKQWVWENPEPDYIWIKDENGKERRVNLWKAYDYFWDQDAVREASLDTAGISEILSDGSKRYRKPWKDNKGLDKKTMLGSWASKYGSSTSPGGRNIRSVWTIATQPYPEAHYACVDEQTECLTQDGWKTYDQIEKSDLIASYDRSIKGCRWSTLKDIFIYQVQNEEMVRIKGRCVDQLLTKNHRCIVKRRSGKNVFVEAKTLKSTDQVITASEWLEENSIKFPERLASIIGWAITEGNFGHDCVTIYQSGDANPEYCKEIEQLLIEEGATFVRANRERQYRGRRVIAISWRITGILAHEILSLCPNKQLPHNFLRWNLDSLYALWNAMMKGDGNFRQGGRTTFVQKDKKIIDDVQALATRLGYSTTLQKRSTFTYSLSKASHQYRHLRDYRKPIFGIEKYTGVVWCPRTEFETFVARRNGKVFITGNTFPEELVERCIKAGCPKGGIVLDPLAGSGTVMAVAEKLNRIGIGFDLGYQDLQNRRVLNNQKVLFC